MERENLAPLCLNPLAFSDPKKLSDSNILPAHPHTYLSDYTYLARLSDCSPPPTKTYLIIEPKVFFFLFAILSNICYNINVGEKTMNYETLLSDAMNWLFSDITRCLWIVGGIAIIGAINGIRISIGRSRGSYNGRIL